MTRSRSLVLFAGTVLVALAALTACGGGGDGDDFVLDDPSLPGTFVPDQGRRHFNYTYSQSREPTPFCDGVATAVDPSGAPSTNVVPTPTSNTLINCYASNPPTSGAHLGQQSNVDLGGGIILPRIPPDPNVYPPEVKIPREAIPHILEHAGVYVAYNCADGDAACADVVERLTGVVNESIDNHNNRAVMANDSDLPSGTIALASWTRIDAFPYADFDDARVDEFIETHSCRFDPEGFCG